MNKFNQIVSEEISLFLENKSYEFQLRNIDGPMYYKRKKGSKTWEFIEKKEFEKGANKDNVIAWMPDLLKEQRGSSEIERELNKLKVGDFIEIQRFGKKNRVYFAGKKDQGYFATTYRPGEKQHRQDEYFKIYPSSKVEILKLNGKAVESSQDIQDKIEAYKELERMEKNDMHKQAYAREKRDPNPIDEDHPYDEEHLSPGIYRRKFAEDVNESELVWHRDKEDRIVRVIGETNWKIQMDNELPSDLKDKVFIPKETYHRIIKGDGELSIEVLKVTEEMLNESAYDPRKMWPNAYLEQGDGDWMDFFLDTEKGSYGGFGFKPRARNFTQRVKEAWVDMICDQEDINKSSLRAVQEVQARVESIYHADKENVDIYLKSAEKSGDKEIDCAKKIYNLYKKGHKGPIN